MSLNALPSKQTVLDALAFLIGCGNSSLRIIDTFNGTLKPTWYIRASRPCYRLHLVQKGSVQYRHHHGEDFELQSGDVILIGPTSSFSARAISHNPWLGSVVFDFQHEPETPISMEWWAAHFDISEWHFAFLNFLRLNHAQPVQDFDRLATAARSALHTVFGLLYESAMSRQVDGNFGSAILRVRRHMDNHPEEEFHLDTLAEIAKLNPSYLSRIFKQQVGISLKSYHVESKMRYARAILREGYVNVSELSDQLGYSEPSAFSRSFKAVHGFSPSQISKGCEH